MNIHVHVVSPKEIDILKNYRIYLNSIQTNSNNLIHFQCGQMCKNRPKVHKILNFKQLLAFKSDFAYKYNI